MHSSGNTAASWAVGAYIKIDDEIMQLTEVVGGGGTNFSTSVTFTGDSSPFDLTTIHTGLDVVHCARLAVTRGQLGTQAATHEMGALVIRLEKKYMTVTSEQSKLG